MSLQWNDKMISTKFYLLAIVVVLSFHCQRTPTLTYDKEGKHILKKACEYLWENQDTDGGWHSKTHGILKTGQALTPYILHALQTIPAEFYSSPNDQVKKGHSFIRNHINNEGIVGLHDPDILEYPNYCTAYSLIVLAQTTNENTNPLIGQMATYLTNQQFTKARGIPPSHPAFGGWGFGETMLTNGYTGHVDLSHTRRVLQSLSSVHAITPEIKKSAINFLRITQKHPSDKRILPECGENSIFYDGGFYYSPVVVGANKGKMQTSDDTANSHYRSYATATCDGLLSLLVLGETTQNEAVASAIKWLKEHPKLNRPEGISIDDEDQWYKTMFYYHLAVRSEVYSQLEWPGNWREQMIYLLSNNQRSDGSFSNPNGARNKEDDPLLATAMAIVTLGNIFR